MGHPHLSPSRIDYQCPKLCVFLASGLVYTEQACAGSKGQWPDSGKTKPYTYLFASLTAIANGLQLITYANGDCDYIRGP